MHIPAWESLDSCDASQPREHHDPIRCPWIWAQPVFKVPWTNLQQSWGSGSLGGQSRSRGTGFPVALVFLCSVPVGGPCSPWVPRRVGPYGAALRSVGSMSLWSESPSPLGSPGLAGGGHG
jgi:hypothetical protein